MAEISVQPLLWGNTRPMPLAYTICTAMSGNGVKMTGMMTIKMRQLMAVQGVQIILVEKYCGAVPGSFLQSTAVPLPASASTAATTATRITVCG